MTRPFSTVLLVVVLCTSCTKSPYSYRPPEAAQSSSADRRPESASETAQPPAPQFTRGEPYSLLDQGSSWTFGLFSKILLLNTKIDSHEISTETEQAARAYAERNHLTRVKVRINEYAPIDEWSRLFDNDEMSLFWRLTVGSLTALVYTVLPGRVFGGDNYNPFTNTVSLYSDHPAVALHEMGHARDFADREWKGPYALMRLLPLAPLYQEGEASGEALGYLEDNRETNEKADAYKVLYPAYGTYIGGELVRAMSAGSQLIFLVPVIPGHILGRYRAAESMDAVAEEEGKQTLDVEPQEAPKGDEGVSSTEPTEADNYARSVNSRSPLEGAHEIAALRSQ